jgi:hypothetical protein
MRIKNKQCYVLALKVDKNRPIAVFTKRKDIEKYAKWLGATYNKFEDLVYKDERYIAYPVELKTYESEVEE